MIKYIVIFLIALLFTNCRQTKHADDVAVTRSPIARNEDSLMIEQLMAQSKDSYSKSSENIQPFDNYLREAEKIALKNKSDYHLFTIYSLLGQRLRNKSYYGEAMVIMEKALTIAEKSDDVRLRIRAYNRIGVIYRRMDENTQAFDMHMKALQLAEECNDSLSISKAVNGMGNVSIAMERYHSAIEYFQRGLSISKKTGNTLGQAINTNNIGEAYQKLNQPDSAMSYFFKSLDYNIQINCRIGQTVCYNSIGNTYITKQQNRLALNYLFKALEITHKLEDRLLTAISYTHIGKTYLNDDLPDTAIEYLQKGLDLAVAIGAKRSAEEASGLLSKAFEAKRNYKQSLEYYKLGTCYGDSILNKKNILHVTTIEAEYKNSLQRLQIDELNKEALLRTTLLSKQRTLLFASIILVIVLILVAVLIVFQGRLRSRYRNLRFQQRLLRSQMNPHFIFNALSAIQVFILENDKDKSSRFLAHFSKLMRHVLRSSNYEFIPIHEEVEMLQYYLKIQQLRFSPPFDFEIIIGDKIKKNKVVIPPMLIQPFVENAIEHGIKQLGEGGLIFIRILENKSEMLIEIEDNGPGLDYNEDLSESAQDHESMALKITNERLDILKKDTGEDTFLEIFDKKKKDPYERGTVVRIVLPLIMQESTKGL